MTRTPIAIAISMVTVLAGCASTPPVNPASQPPEQRAVPPDTTSPPAAQSSSVNSHVDSSVSAGGTSADVQTFTMVSDNLSFSPNALTVKKGKPVTITITNVGLHTFTIDALGVNVPLTKFSATVAFTPAKAGTFTFYCATPGHREAGMVGTLTVTE
jgi:uncharacterized cupredoxin-like copper-binding protein